jgi:hypothetical protein
MIGTTQPESFYVSSNDVHASGIVDLQAAVTIGGRSVDTSARARLGGRQRKKSLAAPRKR